MIKKGKTQRERRVSAKISRISTRPRLSVFKSNRFIYAQIIDDSKGKTLAAAKGVDPVLVGSEVAKKAVSKKVLDVVFDKGPNKYHGNIKVLADAARKGGLNF